MAPQSDPTLKADPARLLSRMEEEMALRGLARATKHRRNEIERLFRRLKGFRRIFSRFDKLAVMFTAFIHFALIVEALR